jgi:hypothetical protein
MRLPIGIVILTALLAACSSPPASDPLSPAERELDICEAVFRHQFEDNASAVQQDAAAYFLLIRKKDADPEFLARFAGHQPPVLPGSKFEIGKGLQFRVDSIEWEDNGSVKVTGGYYEAGLSASGNVYTLEADGDKWVVTADEMEWIS